MSFQGLPAVLLPPRPALRDWPLAGACGGLLLGMAELLFAAPTPLSAPLALLAVASLALIVALAAGLLGVALRAARASYSELVAWVAGLVTLAAALPLALPRAQGSWLLGLGALLCAGLATAGATFAAVRLAERSERAGTPANALLVWGATALVVAAAERALLGAPGLGVAPLALLGGSVLAAALAAGALFYTARRRGSGRPRASFASLFRWLSLLALAAVFTPQALPWLLAGWSGIRYEPGVADRSRPLEALLTLPDGAALVPLLAADGYATAAILADGSAAEPIAAREIDARPSARVQLERELGWLAAAPWLVGPGRSALDRLGLGGDVRTPAQLASDARAWLLRRGASPTPFFLLVDFRRFGVFDRAQSAREEESAVSLLNHLEQAGLSERTVVLLVRIGGAHEPPLRVVVRPPLAWERGEGQPLVARPIQASELCAALREISSGDGVTPIDFPGVIGARPRPAPG